MADGNHRERTDDDTGTDGRTPPATRLRPPSRSRRAPECAREAMPPRSDDGDRFGAPEEDEDAGVGSASTPGFSGVAQRLADRVNRRHPARAALMLVEPAGEGRPLVRLGNGITAIDQ